jgi:pimeloyl-ACP methyl ester carboxylesterase
MLVYDRWGRFGRPVLLLHGLLFDRTMWWPVAAELATATACTVIAPDLPGHGDSPARMAHDAAKPADDPAKPAHDLAKPADDPAKPADDLAKLAHDLAQLVHKLDLHRAPIVVGHAESAALATAFGERFAVHEVLTADDLGDGGTEVPEHFRPYATPRADPDVLTAYESWPPRTRTWPHLADPRGFAAGLQARLTAKG